MARNLIILQKKAGTMKIGSTILLFFLFLHCSFGQIDTTKHQNDTLPGRIYILPNVNRNGVVLPEVEIKEITIIGKQQSNPRKARSQIRQYDKLIYNVKKTYPYAILARERLAEINARLEEIPDEKERREFLKQVEKDLVAEFEDDARGMNLTQGRILMKLIDRETQNTSYDLIRQYRGFLSATFWQTMARIFGANLKVQYDPYGEDALIEIIVRDIEAGWL